MPVFFSIFFSVYLLDLLTKVLVRSRMALGQEIHLLPFFSLTHVENTGIAFGLFQGKNFFFIIFGTVVMAALIYYALRLLREDRVTGLIMAGVLGGALGNITDRIFVGAVTDFLDFHWAGHHWPSFNVADSAICVGMVFLIWRNIKAGKNVSKSA